MHIAARTRLVSESQALFLNAAGERLSTQGIANIIVNLESCYSLQLLFS